MYGLESYEKIKKSSTLGSKQILTYDRNQGINLLSHEGNGQTVLESERKRALCV